MADREYTIVAPDGRELTIVGPDNATPEQLRGAAERAFAAPKSGPSVAGVLRRIPGASAIMAAPDVLAGAVRGAGSIGATLMAPVDAAARALGVDPGSMLGGIVGRTDRREAMTNTLRDLGADTEGLAFGAGKMGAEVAGTLGAGGAAANALARIPGVATAAPALLNAVRSGGMSTAAPGLGRLADLGVRTAGGAISGGLSAGLVNPEDAGLGAVLGGATPGVVQAAGAAGGAVRRMVAPLSEANDPEILSNALRSNLGSFADEATANLRRGTQAGPSMLPGYQPTAAEVARVPSLAALQRTATAVDPAAMNQLSAMATRNQEVIRDSLDDMAGRGGMRDFFASDREATAQGLYDAAFKADASKNLTPGLKGEITKLLKRPDIQDAKKAAQRLAANKGVKVTDGSIQGLHYMKLALDAEIEAAGQKGIAGAQKEALIGNRDRLVGLIENLSPEYRTARTTYAEMSRPINQMDAIDKIADVATNFRDNVTLSSITKALDDKTVAGATGFRGATLENTLDPQQLARLNAIRGALQGVDFAQTAGRGVGSDTVQKLATAGMLPGWSSALNALPGGGWVGGLASRGSDAIYGRANERLSNALAQALLDPAETLALLEFQKQAANPLLQNVGRQAARALPAATAD
jgi:hypothetical protein